MPCLATRPRLMHLDDLMNGEVKEYLGIIPDEVVHGGQ